MFKTVFTPIQRVECQNPNIEFQYQIKVNEFQNPGFHVFVIRIFVI